MANNKKKPVRQIRNNVAAKPKAAAKSKSAREKTVADKPLPLRVVIEKPIRVIIELIIKDERTAEALLGGEAKPVINYAFDLKQCVVTNLSIQNKSVQDPPSSGSIILDHLPLSGNIRVSAMATGAAATSTGTLQLTYQQRTLFNPAEPFKFSGAMGFIETNTKL